MMFIMFIGQCSRVEVTINYYNMYKLCLLFLITIFIITLQTNFTKMQFQEFFISCI